MEPIDKILIRIGVILVGSILGYTSVKNADSLEQVAQGVRSQTTQNAGIVPLPKGK